jgi:hypothetical protein
MAQNDRAARRLSGTRNQSMRAVWLPYPSAGNLKKNRTLKPVIRASNRKSTYFQSAESIASSSMCRWKQVSQRSTAKWADKAI